MTKDRKCGDCIYWQRDQKKCGVWGCKTYSYSLTCERYKTQRDLNAEAQAAQQTLTEGGDDDGETTEAE
ncbi:MAG: hypothetical protein ABH877_03120 [bacterium]